MNLDAMTDAVTDTVADTVTASAAGPDHILIAQLVLAALLLLIAIFGTRGLRRAIGFVCRKIAPRAPEWLLILAEGFDKPLLFLLRSFFLCLAVLALPLPMSVWSTAAVLFLAVVVGLLGWGAWRSADLCRLLLRSAQNRLDLESNRTLVGFFVKIYRVIVATLTVLMVLDIFGIPVTGLLTGAGIAGLAVSLAAQSTLSNLLAGITLVLERPFGIGDYIVLGSLEGTVEEISFRSTRLRTMDNVLVTVENSKICAEYIQNATLRASRLWSFTVGVKYDTSRQKIEQLCAELTKMLQADPEVLPEKVIVYLSEFSASSIDLQVVCYVNTVDLRLFRLLKNRINLAVMDLVAKNGCEFAYPSTSVYLEGDGAAQGHI